MANTRQLDRSFASGEITAELYARFDLDKRQSALALARNFETLPHGPARNRTGFQYVATTKNSGVVSMLIPFTYSNSQSFAIEVGAGYFRFYTNAQVLLAGVATAYASGTTYAQGALVTSGGTTYYSIQSANTGNTPASSPLFWYALPATGEFEMPNPYAAADLANIHYVQSADVLTLVHPNYAPMELRRYGAVAWTLIQINMAPTISPPTGLAAVATPGAGATNLTTQSYVVTSIVDDPAAESVASLAATCSNNLGYLGSYNTITWGAVTGANRYNVYRLSGGSYGFVGQAIGTTFLDNNITADVANAPPLYSTPFTSANNYPTAVGYFQQRRIFAGTLTLPQNVWMTRSATESDMSYTIPTRDDNRIAFRIAAREASGIQHIVPVKSLILFTDSTEWSINSQVSGPITPSNIDLAPESYNGANKVTPVVVGNSILYAQTNGGRIRELSYSWQAGGYISSDVSLLASHLFDYYTINDMAFCRSPYPTLWCISSNGSLLGMTYLPEQQIAAWHHHDTAFGAFESVCRITENNEDMLYAIVNRMINGVTQRFVERKSTRNFTNLANAFFVDAGLTYNGAPATVISGLSHLNGMTVSILADGAVMPQQVVTGGTITLSTSASIVTVGLPITADLETLPLAAQIDEGFAQGKTKNVNKIWLRVNKSSGIFVGPSFDSLVPFKQRTSEPYGNAPYLINDEIEITLDAIWGNSGQVCVRQSDPLPLSIISMTLDVAIGS